ncbi:MAG: acyltransferase [Alphaproteobacteria bacterium]|nr:acyltransferase [Alphaproteobacteria bacterium]
MEKKSMPAKPQLFYLDYYRAYAILTIILGHTACIRHAKILGFQCNLYGFNTALFIFIAGYLFQYLSYKFEYKNYLKKKFLNVFLPYLVLITPLSLMSALAAPVNNTFHNLPFYQKVLGGIIFGQTVDIPTWFIGMIIWFYLLAPVFLKISRSKHFGIILTCSMVYTILSRVPVVTHGLAPSTSFDFKIISLHFIAFFFQSFFHFFSYYLLGMFFCQMKEKHHQKIAQYQTEILKYFGWAFIFSSLAFLTAPINARAYGGFTKLLSCVTFYFLFTCYEERILHNVKLHKTLMFISQYSFGLFLIHQCFANLGNFHTLYELNMPSIFINLTACTFTNFLIALVFFVVVLGASCLTLVILKFILKCFKIKNTRWFIGV